MNKKMYKNIDILTRRQALLKEKQRYNLPLEISEIENIKLELGYPIQKIIGYIEMQNVQIWLDQKVFIPRYETEELLLLAYDFIDKKSKVLDMCCGSGFIGIAIAKNTQAQVTSVDIDISAIIQTKFNAKLNKVNLEIVQSNLFENLKPEKYDLIIANPPYLEFQKLDDSVINFEPEIALFSKPNSYSLLEKIIAKSAEFLNENGSMLFEIDYTHLDFFQNKHPEFEILKDINGKIRFALYKANSK